MSEQSVYKPSRAGAKPIPLSFTGRHLLQSLREAVMDAVAAGDWHAHGGAVSRVRERIAQRMSELERKCERFFLGDVSTDQLSEELRLRGYDVVRPGAGPLESLIGKTMVVNVRHPFLKPERMYAVTATSPFDNSSLRMQVSARSYEDAVKQVRTMYPSWPDSAFSVRVEW